MRRGRPHWAAMNNRHRDIEADAPDRQDEWFIYQTLVGAHPLAFDRAWPVIEKSLRESKRRTSWMNPDHGYERAVRHFVEALVTDAEFLDALDRFVAPLVEPGRVNSLTLVALRLLAQGVPASTVAQALRTIPGIGRNQAYERVLALGRESPAK